MKTVEHKKSPNRSTLHPEMSLFVSEEEEEDEKFYDVVDEDEEDEVVSEIPIYLSSKIDNLTVLQYPNRSKRTQIVSSKIKKQSGIIELEVPLDTSKFFDVDKSTEWGDVRTQSLTGVLKENDIYYVGVLKDNEMTLTPLKSTAQLRPSLKYIDDASFSKRQRQVAMNKVGGDDTRKNEVKVVQMTVKSTMESTQPRLGGALEASKLADDEFYIDYKWNGRDKSGEFMEKLIHDEDDKVLVSETTEAEYINGLFSETIID